MTKIPLNHIQKQNDKTKYPSHIKKGDQVTNKGVNLDDYQSRSQDASNKRFQKEPTSQAKVYSFIQHNSHLGPHCMNSNVLRDS